MKENIRAKLQYKLSKCVVILLVVWLDCLSGTRACGQVVTWTGAGGDDKWSNPFNWDGEKIPGPDDVAEFNENDSPGTNILDMDFTIAGLQYIGESTHLLDLYGSDLQVDDFVNVGVGGGTITSTIEWKNSSTTSDSTLTIGNAGAPGGRSTSQTADWA